MKKLILSVIASFILIAISGCSSNQVKVRSELAKDYYTTGRLCTDHGPELRVIAVFENTLENEKKVQQSIEEVLSTYENYNNIEFYTYNRYRGSVTDILVCNEVVRVLRELRIRVPEKCSELDTFKSKKAKGSILTIDKRNRKIIFQEADRIKFVNKKSQTISTHKDIAKIKVKTVDNNLIVYILNKPYYYANVHKFIVLNNKLLKAFQKKSLKLLKIRTVKLESDLTCFLNSATPNKLFD